MTGTTLFQLFPQPRSIQLTGGVSEFGGKLALSYAGPEAERLAGQARAEARLQALGAADKLKAQTSAPAPAAVTNVYIEIDAELHAQGYLLEWSGDSLRIASGGAEGVHYALVTLEQWIARQGTALEHCRIEDEPDFPVRGVMLDIGRNKIPKAEVLYALVDRLAEMKMNHLQLYMEGYSFEYKAYSHLFPDATPIGAEEFRALDAYAKERFIDLVPNQNCLGHMGPWLAKEEFRPLAEHPEGLPTPLGYNVPPITLNPVDGRSIELVRSLFDELLPNFSSEYVNINLDEPFGLGKGESKARADEIGVGALYMEYAGKVFDIVRGHGKRILMWGDILAKHPETIAALPSDVTVLDWNYESDTSFEEHGKLLQSHGVRYYVCPGTSSWASITGRTDNMLANIADAARSGKKYGAEGLIVADWGDSGHWQALSAGVPGFVYAAAASWNGDEHLDEPERAERYISECVFQDRSGIIGELLFELGRYYHMENCSLDNRTYTSYLLGRGLSTRERLEAETQAMIKLFAQIGGKDIPFKLDFRYDAVAEWLERQKERLSQLSLAIPDERLTTEELANAIRLIELGAGLHRYIFKVDLADAAAEASWLEKLSDHLDETVQEFDRLWLLRNRQGGLASSNGALYKLKEQIKAELDRLKSGTETPL